MSTPKCTFSQEKDLAVVVADEDPGTAIREIVDGDDLASVFDELGLAGAERRSKDIWGVGD